MIDELERLSESIEIKINFIKAEKMQEGRPRESLVLYETPIEVSLACLSR